MKKKIYIAGPITIDPFYYIKFLFAEEFLRKEGYEVYNPAVVNDGLNYKYYIDIGLENLLKCDAICMLPNWDKSKGACLEHHYAEVVGLPILYM